MALAKRARMAFENDAYACGIAQSVANDTIGPGPALKFQTGADKFDKRLNADFSEFADRIGLIDKLKTQVVARQVDGETFGLIGTNPDYLGYDVSIDYGVYEFEQFSNPRDDLDYADGIRLDRFGNPESYLLLREHPGNSRLGLFGIPTEEVAAKWVTHWFRQHRPGQVRGVSEFAPSLELLAVNRRWTRATLNAAETAAHHASMFETGDDADPVTEEEEFDDIPIPYGTGMVLPKGWQAKQLKPEQPTATFAAFKKCNLEEIGRAMCVPYLIVSGNSDNHNYASGRLDWQQYYRMIRTDREQCNRKIISKIVRLWWEEKRLDQSLYAKLRTQKTPWQYRIGWAPFEHVDPLKEAMALAVGLKNGSITLTEYLLKQGRDVDEVIAERNREAELLKDCPASWMLGLEAVDDDTRKLSEQEELSEEPAGGATNGQ